MTSRLLAPFVLGLFACARAASAQDITVSGLVVDARTARPLAHVLVAVEQRPEFVESDGEGHFALALPPGRYTLAISLVGYALLRHPVDVVAAGVAPLRIALAEGAGTVEEHVTVSGTVTPDAQAAPGGALLHGRELQALRGVVLDDPLRALHALPAAAAPDDFYGQFTVRGLDFGHVGLVVDGIPTRYLLHAVHGVTDGGSIAMVNSDAVGSLALMPGGYPQRVGRRLGAEVDVALRDGDRSGVRWRAGLSGTSAAAVAEGPLGDGRGSWLVSGRRSYLDLLLDRIDEGNTLAFGFSDGEAKLVFDVTRAQQIQVLAIVGGSRFTEAPEDLGANDEAQVDGLSWLSGLTWRYAPSPRLTVSQRVYGTGLRFHNTNRASETLDDSRSVDYGWRADGAVRIQRSLVEFGGDVQRSSARHDMARSLNDAPTMSAVNAFDADETASSAYVQAALQPASMLTITPGVRIDRWRTSIPATASPWITAALVLGATRVTVGSGIYRQLATLEQAFGVRGGGTSLRPERATHLDIGVTQRLPRNTSATVTWFARDEQDVLWTPGAEPRRAPDGGVQPGRGDARWINDLDGRAHGLEAIVRRDVPTGLSGWAAYAWNAHRYTSRSTGESFASDAEQPHAVSFYGHWRLSNRTAAGLKFRYGSNYPRVGYFTEATAAPGAPALFAGGRPLFVALGDRRNVLRLPAYARMDARVDRTFTWKRGRMTVFGEVANVLNRQNVRNVPYDVGRNGLVMGGTAAMLPILPSAGFVIEF